MPHSYGRQTFSTKRLRLWGTALLALGWFLHGIEVWTPGLLTRSGEFKGADYVQFYVMGSLVASGSADQLYDKHAHVAEIQRRLAADVEQHAPAPNHAPHVALAFVPFATLAFPSSLLVFTIISAAAYAAAAWALFVSLPALNEHRGTYVLLAVAYPLLLTTLRFGQVTTIPLAACAVAIYALTRGQPVLGGVALGILASKPTWFVVVGPAILLARDGRVAMGMALCVTAQGLLAVLTAGLDGVRTYIEVLATLAADPDLVVLNPAVAHSVRGFLRLAGTPPGVASAISTALLILAWPVARRVWCSAASPALRVGYLLLLTLFVSPHVMTYDLLLSALFVAAFATKLTEIAWSDRELTSAALLVLMYVSSFSVVIAVFTGIQLSTIVIGALLWLAHPHASASPVPSAATMG